jgi:hypothetical protein
MILDGQPDHMKPLFFSLALIAAGVAGCAPPQAGPKTVSFQAAEQASTPATIEGIPEFSSIRQGTGKPTEFVIREESSARKLQVSAPPDVPVPANITSANYVVVTGTYDAAQRKFVATEVRTRVPTREQQPRG